MEERQPRPKFWLIAERKVSEKDFSELWRFQSMNPASLITTDGQPVSVIYPGRPNDERGPDFRDAVIRTGNSTTRGDIEIHLRSGDWNAHHHQADPFYNDVVLHVVRKQTARHETRLESGASVPVLVVDDPVPEEPVEQPADGKFPCSGLAGRINTDHITKILEQAGTDRFREKAVTFTDAIIEFGPDNALYRGLMRSLGYSGNTTAFGILAERLPYRTLTRFINVPETEALSACRVGLLGAAGFLEANFAGKLAAAGLSEKETEELRYLKEKTGIQPVMKPESWQFFRVRPGNSPVRRLLAAADILAYHHDTGLAESLDEYLQAARESGRSRCLRSWLTPSGKTANLGDSRAAVIVINVLLPFLYAFSSGKTEHREWLLQAYREQPSCGENSLEKHMIDQTGLERKTVKTAAIQQGLIHLYHRFCTLGKCRNCVLSQLEAGQDIQ